MSRFIHARYAAIRNQFGTAGLLVAVVALIAALCGGAYAAGGSNATASKAKALTKAQVLALIKANSKPGAPGSPGPAGPAGSPGANGKDGTNGENGKDGTTGFTKTLPLGETEIGTWIDPAVAETPEDEGASPVPISFPIPLGHTIEESNAHFVYKLEWEHAGGFTPPAACPGTMEEPLAEPGSLCIYTDSPEAGKHFITAEIIKPQIGGGQGALPAGAFLKLWHVEQTEFLYGTWAVTEVE